MRDALTIASSAGFVIANDNASVAVDVGACGEGVVDDPPTQPTIIKSDRVNIAIITRLFFIISLLLCLKYIVGDVRVYSSVKYMYEE
ncbi:hypothetical protein ACFLWB_02610 [Chloroflexota bacterium]